jgi:hypothetical protein
MPGWNPESVRFWKEKCRTCTSSIHTSHNDDDGDGMPTMSRAYNSSSLNPMQLNNMASYFASNFPDDNPYVFDGVKVEVRTKSTP